MKENYIDREALEITIRSVEDVVKHLDVRRIDTETLLGCVGEEVALPAISARLCLIKAQKEALTAQSFLESMRTANATDSPTGRPLYSEGSGVKRAEESESASVSATPPTPDYTPADIISVLRQTLRSAHQHGITALENEAGSMLLRMGVSWEEVQKIIKEVA